MEGIDWASLEHAYGPADDVPGWLRDMVSPDPDVREEAFGNFYGAVLHQGSVHSSTVASLPFLFATADDPATPDRGEVVALVLSIGREVIGAEEVHAVICGPDGEDSTICPDTANLTREHADTFVAYAGDPDPEVRRGRSRAWGSSWTMPSGQWRFCGTVSWRRAGSPSVRWWCGRRRIWHFGCRRPPRRRGGGRVLFGPRANGFR
ncbi:hypothetical protein [Streptomyces sp. NPDC004284]|uniref:hypothetical protein n=1 Tax=Streptomyces sp. NPDC004284 TaxID=3364695 RepID=UPI0036B1D04F